MLRKKGCTYSQIKNELGISKSTLSSWLRNLPLSEERLCELRNNEVQIEKTRETKRKKKIARRQKVYNQVCKDIKKSKNKDFLAGFYLYWGEGTKTAEYTISLTNSDPSIIRCFVEWVGLLGVHKKQLKLKLHTYEDQNEAELKQFWSRVTGIPVVNFYKTYFKKARSDGKTYKGMFPYGTCVVIYSNRDTYEYVLEGIRCLRDRYKNF